VGKGASQKDKGKRKEKYDVGKRKREKIQARITPKGKGGGATRKRVRRKKNRTEDKKKRSIKIQKGEFARSKKLKKKNEKTVDKRTKGMGGGGGRVAEENGPRTMKITGLHLVGGAIVGETQFLKLPNGVKRLMKAISCGREQSINEPRWQEVQREYGKKPVFTGQPKKR